MVSGIYSIRNKTTGKKYVGSAKNVKRRWRKHIERLRAGLHFNKILQNAWNKYGEDDFEFTLLMECSVEDLREYEQIYIDSGEFEYNIATQADASMRGRNHTEETKRKTSATLMGHPVSERVREGIRERARGNKIWLGRKHKLESKQKMREAKLGKKASLETRRKLSEVKKGNKYALGHTHVVSEETRRKISASTIGIKKTVSEETKQRRRQLLLGNKFAEGHTYVASEETKRKISKANTGRHVSEETRRKISEAHRGKTTRLGMHHTEETKRKIGDANRGRHPSEESRKRMSEAHKNPPEEIRKKLRDAWVRRKRRNAGGE